MNYNICECYKVEHKAVYSEDGRCRIESEERCSGTKEMDMCNCRGNKLCCDFYPKKRREGIREWFAQMNMTADGCATIALMIHRT